MKAQIETSLRSFLIAILLLNSVGPSVATAQSLQQTLPGRLAANNAVPDANNWLANFETGETETATPSPTNIEATSTQTEFPIPSPTVEATFTPTIEDSSTPTVEATSTPTTEAASTPTGSPTPTETMPASSTVETTATATGPAPLLLFNLSVSPDQAAPGDEVTFTIKITNNGQLPATGLSFSNTLAQQFGNGKNGFKEFHYDVQSRLLTWGDSGRLETLLPGASVTLQYVVQIDPKIKDEVQVIDSALLFADGLSQPLASEAALMVLASDKRLTRLDGRGGKAQDKDGQVVVNLPQGLLPASRGIIIRDLKQGPGQPAKSPKSTFTLEMVTLPDASGVVPGIPAPGALGASGENDRVAPLQPVEAKFSKPVELTISLDGISDLAKLLADQEPYLSTLDEVSGTWVRMPLKSIDRQANTVMAEITHFSTWGLGIGPSFPGGNALLFDTAYPNLFTGRSNYSVPIWTPAGRDGMAPSLALSYSSGTADGVLGDVQPSWAGMGWNVDTVEIARKITTCSCSSPSYGYENTFLLLFNGTGYKLLANSTTPGRYHTTAESFLYVQLHNDDLGNNSPAAQNTGGEWWEVVEKNGTRWRLGWNQNSEQLAAMKGYPGAATGAWASLGYAGHATDVVAFRWRADQVTDTFGNRMISSYFEETRLVQGTSTNYDRASYLDTFTYTNHASGTPAPGYSVVFIRESRSGTDMPSTTYDADNWDDSRLDRIEVRYGANVVRTYDLSYNIRSYSDDGKSWQTTVLSSVAVSGGTTNAPTTTFTYTDFDNRANCGTGCQEWAYPRLSIITNGRGGSATYTYSNDGRPSTSWFNWRVDSLAVADGINAGPMTTNFSYSGPCYQDPSAGWCSVGNVGELVGYAQTTATNKDFNGTTTLAIAVHKFYTDEPQAGAEYETQRQDASGTILSQTSITYTNASSSLPAHCFFIYTGAVDEYLRSGGSLNRVSHTEYVRDTNTGNLTSQKQFDGTPTLYRETDYQYVTNTSPLVWILDKVWKQQLKNAGGTVLAEQQFGFDSSLPGSGSPSLGSLTLSRVVDGSQTIDTGFVYDSYGNLTQTHAYTAYGSVGSQPGGSYRTSSIVYDTGLYTYPISATNALSQSTSATYDYALGVPLTATDANSNTTTTTYDGLGRALTVKYPGYGQPNVQYIYPASTATAPFALKMDLWDETASLYRSVWQVSDGLGRTLQTQSPDQTAGSLVLTDTSYNALGQVKFSGLPRTLSGTGGGYFAPTWASVPHSIPTYDALGRSTSVVYPDSSQETTAYSGLRTTSVDRNLHQKVQENDAFGRLVKVEEYTGSGTYTLYATTAYQYDQRDLLTQVTDAQSNLTTINYNGFGRKTSMTDPDMGYWTYAYDVLGNLITQTDARTCVTSVGYDTLNRPTGKTYTGPGACATTPAVTYTYDSTANGNQGIGRRTGMTDGSGSSAWIYNALGQSPTRTNTVDGTTYTTTNYLDAFGRSMSQLLPSGELLSYSYNAMGAISGLNGWSTYLSNVHYNSSGQVIDQQLGNGILQQSCYDANTLRLSAQRAYPGSLQACGTNPSSPRLNLSYTYQPNGNISQMVDATRSETLNYTYDELDRLLSASGPYSRNYNYNSVGNLTSGTTDANFAAISLESLGSHTCAVTTSSGLKCWGLNDYGEVGDGSTTNRFTPVDVSGLSSGISAVAVGGRHTCALTTAGGVKCWGQNFYGQVGDNTTATRTTPVDVTGLTSGVTAIAAGSYHSCALTSGGGVKCWGFNANGQVGDNTTTNRLTPVDVSGLTSGVQAISAGNTHTCALLTAGGVKCWGGNNFSQLGDGTTTQRLTPVDVTGLTSGVGAIAAGFQYTCARTTVNGVKCWGNNANGQLGDGTTTTRSTAVDVSGLTSGVAAVTAGQMHTCARTTTGGLKCWGANTFGQVGDGTLAQYLTPVDVSGLTSGVSAVAAGYTHTCALTTANSVKCWGDNSLGQLGFGTGTQRATPVNVSGLNSVPNPIGAGQNHTCDLVAGGGVKCWGDNTFGQVGDNTTTQRATPVDVTGLTSGVQAISVGWNHTCALTTGGGVKCWGAGGGRVGDGTTIQRNAPVDVSGLTSGVTAITAGGAHTCALTTSGGVKNSLINHSAPADVTGLTSGVVAIATGVYHTCALTTSGGVKCWGYNNFGGLGDGTTTQRLTPVDVSGLTSGVSAIASNNFHTCALTTSGGVKCWGYNPYGQIGDGTTIQRNAPVDVSGLTSGVSAITVGAYHTCALTTTGGMKCWGYNMYGQIGDGTLIQRNTPVDVSGLTSGVSAIATGSFHTCAIKTGVGMQCWGYNAFAQIGDATTSNKTTAVAPSPTTMTASYTYGSAAHKHAVTGLSGETYIYDANGNMTSRTEGGVTYSQAFDAENRLVSVTTNGLTTQFVYDGDGHLVKKIQPDNSRTIYVGGVYEVSKNPLGTVTDTTTYYPAAGAMRVNGTLYYTLKDQVSSASVVLDASGNTVGENRYYPFGETRVTSGSLFTDRLFTGQRQMAGLGLYDYGTRFYSPKLGRFISPDTIVPGVGKPQSLNRYSYVGNNPINFNDPSGHWSCAGMGGGSNTAFCEAYNPDNHTLPKFFTTNDLLQYRPTDRKVTKVDVYATDAWAVTYYEDDRNPSTPDYSYSAVAVGTLQNEKPTTVWQIPQGGFVTWNLVEWRAGTVGTYSQPWSEDSEQGLDNEYGPYQGLYEGVRYSV